MKNRIHFKNLVVSADELPQINLLVKLLSELAPSDAFILIEFNRSQDGYSGTIKLSSPMENFEDKSSSESLVPLMQNLSDLTMIYIEKWRENRFSESPEKMIS